MLTRKQIRKVRRMIDQTPDPGPNAPPALKHPKPPTLVDRIIAILTKHGMMSTHDLARKLWDPQSKAWRYAAQGGPPGWVLTLGAAIARSQRSKDRRYLETTIRGFDRMVYIGYRKAAP